MVSSICKSQKNPSIINIYSKNTHSITVKEFLIIVLVSISLIPMAFAQEFPELEVKVEVVTRISLFPGQLIGLLMEKFSLLNEMGIYELLKMEN